MIFYEKDELDDIFFLIKGEVKLYKVDRFGNEVFLNKIYGNSLIYTLTTFDEKNNMAFYNVESLDECEVLLVNIKEFKNYFMNNLSILKGFFNESLNFINKLHYILNRDIVYDSTAKVAYMLCNDIDSFNNMKKREVAYSLHIQPETLSRILKKFAKKELITADQNIKIIDLENLKKFYM